MLKVILLDKFFYLCFILGWPGCKITLVFDQVKLDQSQIGTGVLAESHLVSTKQKIRQIF